MDCIICGRNGYTRQVTNTGNKLFCPHCGHTTYDNWVIYTWENIRNECGKQYTSKAVPYVKIGGVP